ncbi:BTAD domain-containing putative transcriptional regulator [Gordonia sp. NPDC127522]|uniref:BTAD domain-containing putative transcriptional regulator n=1 Tax=Gordonia sp. NPDC127522 TaxID=3345390 RepID=UPI00363D6E9C
MVVRGTEDGHVRPAVEVGLLGALRLRVDGVEVAVPGERRRALLALLTVAGRYGMGTGRLVDALWGDDLPREPIAALHNLVSRLRRHLGRHGDLLERRPDGYRLRVSVVDVMIVRDLLASAADTPDPAERLRLTVRARELWRGEPLGEFAGIPDLDTERVALEDLHNRLADTHVEALVECRDPSATATARAGVASAPLRESSARLLIRALAADGRVGDAMAVAMEFRDRLRERTGLDPSPALASLEQRVAAGSEYGPAETHHGSGVSSRRRPAPPAGPLVGRERERAEIIRLLSAHRVVTLTGPGGVGKTSLALDVAADPAVFPGYAVVVVNLAAVARADRVLPSVVSTLGLEVGVGASVDAIARAVDGSLLLVLDNCEHVLSSCREVIAAIVELAPAVRILATSRVVLSLPAEYVLRLQPLTFPTRIVDVDVDAVARQPAVRAFVEHALRRNPDFAVSSRELADLVDVVRRVDGLPLGIELAARQAAVMPMSAVARMLDGALDLATGTGPDDQRRLTLRSSIDMSFRRLTVVDQAVLAALAPFPGGVSLRTFESVARSVDAEVIGAGGIGVRGDGGLDPVETLHRLIDSSLLVADASGGRYRLLHLIRTHLLDHLDRAGVLAAAEDRFLDECVATVRDIGDEWLGVAEFEANERLHAEMDNLRSARDLALARGRVDVLVAITTSLSLVSTWRNLTELWTWAIESARSVWLDGHPDRAEMLSAAAEAARLVGEFDLAVDFATAALRPNATGTPPDPDAPALVGARAARAAVAHFRGDFAVAVREWTRCGTHPSLGSAFLASAALAASYAGDSSEAARLLAEARSTLDPSAGPSQHAFLDYVHGELLSPHDPSSALALYERAHERAAGVGATFIVGVARVGAAACLVRVGDVPRAAQAYVVLLGAWRDSGQPTQLWTTARDAAALLRARGRIDVADLLVECADLDPAAAVDTRRGAADHADGDMVHTDNMVHADTAAVLDRAMRELREIGESTSPDDRGSSTAR